MNSPPFSTPKTKARFNRPRPVSRSQSHQPVSPCVPSMPNARSQHLPASYGDLRDRWATCRDRVVQRPKLGNFKEARSFNQSSFSARPAVDSTGSAPFGGVAGVTDPEGPLTNKLVRQALNHAVNRDEIVEFLVTLQVIFLLEESEDA